MVTQLWKNYDSKSSYHGYISDDSEMTLSFVPKVIIVILTIAIFSNYLILGITDYFMFIFERVATLN